MEKLDTYSLDWIVNKYLDINSTVNLMDSYVDVRQKIFSDLYTIKNIVKRLFLKKEINIYDSKISQILSYYIEMNKVIFNSISRFRQITWEHIFQDDSYIGFLLKLYNIPKFNSNSCPCASTDKLEISQFWMDVIKNQKMNLENESKEKEEKYIEYRLRNRFDEEFSIKLKQIYPFSFSDLIFTFISKYDKQTLEFFESNEIIKVVWPEWCKNIHLSNFIVFGNNLYFTDITGNYNIILSLGHERILWKKLPTGYTVSGEKEIVPTCKNYSYDFNLNLDRDIYFTFSTTDECGENYIFFY